MDGPDPITFSCQQNFTIMTTDGYWNAQTETPGRGPVKIDGTTLVGQEDGDPDCHVTDPYCSHPFFDGIGASIQCDDRQDERLLAGGLRPAGLAQDAQANHDSTYQVLKDHHCHSRADGAIPRDQESASAQTTQTTQTVTQLTQTTTQYAKEKHHTHIEKYKVQKSQDQTTMARQQYRLQTIQNVAQTAQMQQVDDDLPRLPGAMDDRAAQSLETIDAVPAAHLSSIVPARGRSSGTPIGSSSSSARKSTTCRSPAPARRSPLAWLRKSSRRHARAHSTGAPYGPGPDPTGTCTASGGVDPTWVRTECSDGPLAVAYGPVNSCAPRVGPWRPELCLLYCDIVPVGPYPVARR